MKSLSPFHVGLGFWGGVYVWVWVCVRSSFLLGSFFYLIYDAL